MNSCMNRIGLALSGGGFRASLYHLGLVRFLRDGGILPRITHITSVSGGSIFAAHLVLNWDRYNGSPAEFEDAASEFLAFMQLDVRNRIARRFLLALPLRGPRRLLGLSNRKLTRTGLLEHYYQRYLYGDTSLFELPEKPALHILTTNLSEGCLCSFNRDGLLMMRRQPGNTFRIDRIHVGLATVPMAVTASSAFPGFFPPLELSGADVGAGDGEFGRQSYTDGGVFDNLGVRMFGLLERPLLAEGPLSRDDFYDLGEFCEALREAGRSGQDAPLGRLAQILVAERRRPDPPMLTDAGPTRGAGLQGVVGTDPAGIATQSAPAPVACEGDGDAAVLPVLWDLMRHFPLQREPLFAGLRPLDPGAEALLRSGRHRGRVLEGSDQLWLNRHLIEAAYRQATGHPCFRRLNSGLDGVLVSDVGMPISVQGNRRAGGLIRTALRATDIVMDRVWQLEMETFRGTPGFVFAPSTEVVEHAEDPTALHPEIQRQVAHIRTDLDRFSPLEISSLARHGYCVGRKACRARPDLFGPELPDDAPWDPIPWAPHAASAAPAAPRPSRPLRSPPPGGGMGERAEPAAATVEARTLQASALRRVWSTLLDPRDWASYVYVPLLIPILVLLPYFGARYYQRSHRISQLVESLAQGSPDLKQMSLLLEGPMQPWVGEAAEEVRNLDEPDLKGFEVLQDSRILDLRKWTPTAPGKAAPDPSVYGYRRLKILKLPDNPGNDFFRFRLLPTSPAARVRFPSQRLRPRLRRSNVEGSAPGEQRCIWEATVDFRKVPAGDHVDLIYEYLSSGEYLQYNAGSATVAADIRAKTAELTRWILLPEGRTYRSFRLIRYETGKPETAEAVKIVSEYLAEDYTILSYKLLSLKPGYTYELTWYYQ
jgi:predicted acylesterase/phospholipase RssA